MIRSKKGRKVYFRSEKLEFEGRNLVKLSEKVQQRVTEVQNQIKDDYSNLKEKASK